MRLHVEDEFVVAQHRRGNFGFGHRGRGDRERAPWLSRQRRVDRTLGGVFLLATGVEGQQCERGAR